MMYFIMLGNYLTSGLETFLPCITSKVWMEVEIKNEQQHTIERSKKRTSYEHTNCSAFFPLNYEQSIKCKHTHIVVLQTGARLFQWSIDWKDKKKKNTK